MAVKPITNKHAVVTSQISRAEQKSTKDTKVRGNRSQTVTPGKDFSYSQMSDIRLAQVGDMGPTGNPLQADKGMEIGHMFKLGAKYSEPLQAKIADVDGKLKPFQMGCYGIGVTRVVAAAIEQNNDDHGIIWPDAIAPFDVILIPINMNKSYRVKEATEELYKRLQEAGFDALMDDRDQRPGVKFADADLVGIPNRLVIAEKAWDQGQIEYKSRRSADTEMIDIDGLVKFLKTKRSS